MAITSQIYKWSASDTSSGNPVMTTADKGSTIDIFTNDKGSKLRKPNTIPANAFVVVEKVAMTPSYYVCGDNSTRWADSTAPTFRGKKIFGGVAGPRAYFQFKVNGTQYFTNPDGTPNQGIPGTASPFPASPDIFSSLEPLPPEYDSKTDTKMKGLQEIPMPYNLYVLPGQTFKGTGFFSNGYSLAGGAVGEEVTAYDEKNTYTNNDEDFEGDFGYTKPSPISSL